MSNKNNVAKFLQTYKIKPKKRQTTWQETFVSFMLCHKNLAKSFHFAQLLDNLGTMIESRQTKKVTIYNRTANLLIGDI